MSSGISKAARRVLRELRDSKAVLLTGPPATGKTAVMLEVRNLFVGGASDPVSIPEAEVPIPAGTEVPTELLPSPQRTDRRVFEITMDQHAKFKDFWRAEEIAPGAGQEVRISKGILYRANEHALTPDGASLVEIDELNRGPAVGVLGRSVAAFEADKRLDPDTSKPTARTATFQLPDDRGELVDYALSAHLYILAAQNNADTSVEPIDVAWLRRFSPIEFRPDRSVLIDYFGIEDLDGELPERPDTAAAVYIAAVRAWEKVNYRLEIGRGRDFQIGHGVFMGSDAAPPDSPEEALKFILKGWRRIEKHISEVFFNNVEGQVAVLYVGEAADHPYSQVQESFGSLQVPMIRRPDQLEPETLYRMLRAIARAS